MRTHVDFSAVLLVATAATARGPARNRQLASSPQSRPPAAQHLVANEHRPTVRIFAVRGTLRHRLSLVTTLARRLPCQPVYETGAPLVLEPVTVGSRESYLSELFHVQEGVAVEWRAGERLHQSMVLVH